MFEAAELGHRVSKAQWEAQMPELRLELLKAQYELLEKRSFSVLVVLSGIEGAGKGETINLLNEWLDPRHVQTHGLGPPSEEERTRPSMWRYWQRLPPKGKLGLFVGSWYTRPLLGRAAGGLSASELEQEAEEIVRFERMLASEGVLVLKFWLHLSKSAQRERFRALESSPRTRWRVTKEDWDFHRRYERHRAVAERLLRRTSMAFAPWTIVEGSEARYRSLAVGRVLLRELRRRLDEPKTSLSREAPPAPLTVPVDALNVLSRLDLSRKLSRARYETLLERCSRDLALLSRSKKMRQRAIVGVWEGMDAAGKGGSIRRVTRALDARYYDVVPISAPTDEERARPYLWRFWRRLPRRTKFALFDRSWYGRVLVERVEGLTAEADWRRAYSEINDFEEQMSRSGLIVVKFWLHISPEEQLRRFEAREKTPFKKYKLTEDDWKNRSRCELYAQAACDMIERTSTSLARWSLVAAEDKRHARIEVLKTLIERIESALDG